MKKKILIVTNFYNPYNGMGRFIIDLSKILKKNNYNIIILTGKTDKNSKKIEKNDGIIIYRSPISFRFNRGYFSLSLIKSFIGIQKKVDYVHFQFPLVEILPLTLLTKKTKILQYNCLPAFVPNSLTFIITNIYFSISVFFSMFFCNKIITHTNDYFYSKFTNYLFKYKTTEIFPFIKYSNINNLDNKILLNNKIPIFGFLGRICEEKGIEIIIQSSKILDSKHIKHQIFIAGDLLDERFKKNINRLISLSKNAKSIKFLGKLTEKEKYDFFNKIHILLIPSINSFEAFGIVQLEAMNSGKLVIASSLKGVRIPIKHTNNGYITNIKDSNDLSKKMIDIIEMAKNKSKKDVINSCNNIFDYYESINKYLSIFSSK